jgi:5-oxoprolinase (ATP-hydrolysing)
MTNSRLTDPEILETRYPVLLERFAVRVGSGGAGRQRGGDGVVRHIRFRAAMRANILSNRREVPPRGIEGGGDAKGGVNRVVRADGSVEALGATASAEMRPGDMFVIETPGGGGFGLPSSSPSQDGEGNHAKHGGGVNGAGLFQSPLHHPSGGSPPHAAHGEE